MHPAEASLQLEHQNQLTNAIAQAKKAALISGAIN